ncbi:MAG TPA: outer membrane beta-barrel domain-containing protein [Polyangiaceae bacterium LLY-WYZ-14_1]|jgi:outer membrane beta-barrel protein|nr:outer membrane beta-barrel domain-containing protein [Polyangiaceae bacterium LLY-WYZ-14_1]
MKRALNALLLAGSAAALCAALPSRGQAQDMTFDLDEAETEGTEAEGEEPPPEEGGGEGEVFEDDVISELAATETQVEEEVREAAPRRAETVEDIYAVQQIYALRSNRVEVAPSVGFTLNDPYISHPSVGIAVNYWWTNVLALGVNFNWYQGLESESDLNFFVRRSTRLAVPITEYQLGANLNFTYVPLYGKFAMFNEFLFQWDAYLVGGVGIMRTRPIPVVDPDVRTFEFDFRVAFNVGVGIRVFATRYLAIFAELRDYAFLDRLENLDVSLENRFDEDTWLDDSPTLTNNVTVQIGFTLFFPFEFDYRLPK